MNPLSASVNELRDNPEQWTALTTEGHCIVLAPPGSGKTKLLATRVAVDLANKIAEPQGAACVTMTNPATGELRDRLGALGGGQRESVFVGTVHSFVLSRIVLPFAAYVGRPELLQVSIASQADMRGPSARRWTPPAEVTVAMFGRRSTITAGGSRRRRTGPVQETSSST